MKIRNTKMKLATLLKESYVVNIIPTDLNFDSKIAKAIDAVYDLKNRILDAYGDELYVGETYRTPHVYSLAIKETANDTPDFETFMDALSEMHYDIANRRIKQIAVLKDFCAENGFEWSDVKKALELEFEDSNIEILVFTLE